MIFGKKNGRRVETCSEFFDRVTKFKPHKTQFNNQTQIWYVGTPNCNPLDTQTYLDYNSAMKFLDKDMFSRLESKAEMIEYIDGTKVKAINSIFISDDFCNID